MKQPIQALNLSLVLIGNSLQRIATGASGVLVGLYLAQLANRGFAIGAGLVGIFGAVSFGAELVAAMPMGVASDAIAPRGLMTAGSVLGAAATQLFGLTQLISIFFVSRALKAELRFLYPISTVSEPSDSVVSGDGLQGFGDGPI